ncbi:response regulator transcription factor [Candidatus Magnetobacterium casense]|uniref:Response regulator transcription factor n=1 Tax=Candidatus Magnetobacterium casense TaxID=1455061 RepID=A0ABS6RY15_9BACT|nr:response regulator transcription factor [Candidatus Magnetobacterium casensis]MBV6341525.1 response regulator transcription factor [Candidatus Magnetobacterium casensis]
MTPLNAFRHKVLLIEDEGKISDIISTYLLREGYTVFTGATGAEGLRQMSQQPDLIILDLRLPDMDGEDLCRMIRADYDIPIIMLTAKTHEDDRVRGLLMGADDYVLKPFSPRELMARVKVCLRRAGKKQRTLSFNNGKLVIDMNTHNVIVNGKVVTLTPTEFNMLLVLAGNPNKVLTRPQLTNAVLGYDFDGYDRTIDAHMKNMRQKLGQFDYVKTVYGVGYRFNCAPDED